MWLIIIFIATILSPAAYFWFRDYRKKLKLGLLTLMMLGTFLMVLVDHIASFIKEGTFIQVTTDGLIHSGAVLGLAMITPIVIIWIITISIPLIRKQI